jgi:hypothetical protein
MNKLAKICIIDDLAYICKKMGYGRIKRLS